MGDWVAGAIVFTLGRQGEPKNAVCLLAVKLTMPHPPENTDVGLQGTRGLPTKRWYSDPGAAQCDGLATLSYDCCTIATLTHENALQTAIVWYSSVQTRLLSMQNALSCQKTHSIILSISSFTRIPISNKSSRNGCRSRCTRPGIGHSF
jgi:hypothetical protein